MIYMAVFNFPILITRSDIISIEYIMSIVFVCILCYISVFRKVIRSLHFDTCILKCWYTLNTKLYKQYAHDLGYNRPL